MRQGDAAADAARRRTRGPHTVFAARRWGRRALIGRLASGAALAGAAALSACAGRSTPRAGGGTAAASKNPQPTPANTTTTIVFYAKPPNASANQNTLIRIMQEVLAPYYATHKGVFVHLIPQELPTSQIATGIISGQQMDIIYDNYFAPYYQQQLVVPLRPYFERDSVDPGIWNPAQYALYNTAQGPMAIPVYTGTSCIAVNEGALDSQGVAYPDPNWTHVDFAAKCRQLTHPVGSKTQTGGSLFWYNSGPSKQASWPFKAFGGNQVSPVGAPSQLSSPKNIAALNWLYQELIWPKICLPHNVIGTSQFINGQLAMMDIDTWELLSFAESVGNSVKFDFVPYPFFPTGRAAFCTADFYAIAANCKHIDAAWELLRWVSVETPWQQATFSYALRSPALNSLWEQWATTLQTVVPYFKGKAMQWFGDAASKGYAYPVEYYPYVDERIWGILPAYFDQLYAHKATVTGAAQAIDQVVNGVETAAKAAAAAQHSASVLFPTNGPRIASVPYGT